MKKRILSLIILFAMILPFIPTPASAAYNAYIFDWGSGKKDDPYLVNSSSDMEKLIKQVNSGNTFRGEYIKLAANISFTPSAPIGDYPYNIDNAIGFEGTFDGNNCTITYTINNKGTDRCAGLFGYNSGTIKNLKVNATITVSSGLFIGGVAAYNDGTITNCTSSGTLSASCVSRTYIGGIAGYNTDGTIQRCENSATIQHVSGNAGGIVGRTDSYSKTNKVEICSNSGPVTTTNSMDTGGIAGSVYNCNIVNCYNAATITGTGNVGGIVGKFSSDSGSISNCYDIGTQTLIKPSLEGGSGNSSTRCDDIVAFSDTVTPKNCFTNRNYSDGEITYSLQSANSVPVWGQEIGVDPYPIFTEDIEKSVRRVQFYDTGVIQTNYVNYNKKIPTPPTMSEKDTAAFLGWVSSKDMKEPNYNADTLVTEDMSFYALYRVNFAGQSDNIAISVSNGRDSYINLYPYLKYYSFNSSVSAGKFTYDIIEGNDELNAGISDDSLVIPGSAMAGTYNIKVKATEKQPFISTISFDNYGTEPVTLNITVTVIDTINNKQRGRP